MGFHVSVPVGIWRGFIENPELLWPRATAELRSAWTGQSPVTTRTGYSNGEFDLADITRACFKNAFRVGRRIPQGLKPRFLAVFSGTTEVVPFPKPAGGNTNPENALMQWGSHPARTLGRVGVETSHHGTNEGQSAASPPTLANNARMGQPRFVMRKEEQSVDEGGLPGLARPSGASTPSRENHA